MYLKVDLIIISELSRLYCVRLGVLDEVEDFL